MFVYGKNACREILESDKYVIKAFFEVNKPHELLSLTKKRNIPTVYLTKKELDQQFSSHHQGVALEIKDYPVLSLHDALTRYSSIINPVLILLDGITDPHNLGAIIRSVEAGGVQGIILPKNRSVGITPTVAKVASGALEHVDIIEVTNPSQTVEELKKNGYWIVGTDMVADKRYDEIDVSVPLCIIIGSEGKGISRLLKEKADYNVFIPMKGTANSLNASVSAGIIIFEILKKKGF